MSSQAFPLRAARIPLYAKFVRIYIVDGPLAMLVGLMAAYREVSPSAENLAKSAICVALGTMLFYLVHALDDITGVKTGTDLKTAPRKASIGEPKLLATGEISMAEAKALVLVMTAAALALLVAFIAMTTWFVTAVTLAAVIVTGQYSYGARWSYRGLGEANVVLNLLSCVVVPYAFLTGRVRVEVVLLGLMCGLFLVVVTFCSNLVDMEDDRSTGRTSLCVLLGPRRVKVAFLSLLALLWTLYAGLIAAGAVPRALAAAFPLTLLHARAARHFLGDRPLAARPYAFRASRLHALLACGVLLFSIWSR